MKIMRLHLTLVRTQGNLNFLKLQEVKRTVLANHQTLQTNVYASHFVTNIYASHFEEKLDNCTKATSIFYFLKTGLDIACHFLTEYQSQVIYFYIKIRF
jgi:hypothetical protein